MYGCETLRKAEWATPAGDFVIWPMTHEILRLRLNAAQLGHRAQSYWDFVETLTVALGGQILQGLPTSEASDTAVDLLRAHFGAYQSLNRPKALLRREYPLTVAVPVFLAAHYGQRSPQFSLKQIVEQERRSDGGRLEVRSSRNSIGSLTFRSARHDPV